MNARALLICLPSDFHSSPKHNFPPDIFIPRKSQFRLHFRFRFRFHVSRGISVTKKGLVRRRGIGKVWAEVKSEQYDVADSVPQAVKFKDSLSDVVLDDLDDAAAAAVSWREEFPKRWVIVNMSIAILPMSQEYNWNPATVGLIQSSFFWGYLLTQVAGGIWADKVGGKLVLGFGVVWWSIATALTPIAARVGLPFLLVVRAFMGIGEGVAMPAMNNLLSKWVPVAERSRSLALVYSGMYLGSVTGLAFSPLLIHNYGWPSVFYSFGSLGSVWVAVWLTKAYSSPLDDPQLRPEEKKLILKNSISKEPVKSIPWRLILSKAPVWALIVSHFCHNWGTFILLTWMPTYYNQSLEAQYYGVWALLCIALAYNGIFCKSGRMDCRYTSEQRCICDQGSKVIMQTIGFLGPAFFLTQLSHVNSPAMAILCMSCSQGTDAFSQSGLYSNHQDIAPRYSGVLLGLSNTAGVLAGVFGTAATGYILQHDVSREGYAVDKGLANHMLLSAETRLLLNCFSSGVLGMMSSRFQLDSTWLEPWFGIFSQPVRK
ncbi:unnamed protein product [Camellia sinensis]